MANLKFVSAVSFLRIVLVLVLVVLEKYLSCRVLAVGGGGNHGGLIEKVE